MPGVVVSTATRSGPVASLRSPSGQFFVVGMTERGLTDKPNLVRGMADVERALGTRVSYGAVYDQLKTFFDEGGRQAQVSRVVGAGATKGTLTLQDRAGTPLSTLRADAASAGSWSTQVKVEVKDGSVANTFRVVVTLNDVVVEDVTNIPDPATAVARFAGSQYIRFTDLGSATAAPANNPRVLTATPLSAGTDDRASVVAQTYVDALADFEPGLGDGAVAIPGQNGSTIWNGIIAHCEANRRVALLAAPQNEAKATLLTNAGTLDSEYAGMFAPWIKVSDGGAGTRAISPEGFVAACRARAHEAVGPWAVPAGAAGKGETIVDLVQTFTSADANDLDQGKVSVIRKVGAGFRLYGWRSLSNDVDNFSYLKDRDLLNRIVVDAEERLEEYVFAPIDVKGQLLSQINAELVGIVGPIAAAGGLFARIADDGYTIIDPGFKVETGSEVNTPESLAANEVRARLSLRIAPTSGLVSLTIVKTGLLSGL